mmetsp:Transcript_59194/g.150337  ORF Transcript_59194/g.150337 Transcript_59194/m.150337 type:complete len:90 (+) Transcript_59194:891-1160(+)
MNVSGADLLHCHFGYKYAIAATSVWIAVAVRVSSWFQIRTAPPVFNFSAGRDCLPCWQLPLSLKLHPSGIDEPAASFQQRFAQSCHMES